MAIMYISFFTFTNWMLICCYLVKEVVYHPKN